MRYKRTAWAMALVMIVSLSFSSCTQGNLSDNRSSSSVPSSGVSTVSALQSDDDMFTDRDKEIGYDENTAIAIALNDNSTVCDSQQVNISGNVVTITSGGTYLLSGSLTDGRIVVDAANTDKLQLILDGVDINCDTSAAIYIKQADKVFITLADGSQNTLTNQQDFVAIDDNNIDAVIFSKDDLTLNGTGTLTIRAAYGHGIVSKDDLVITSGTYIVTAASHALSGKDSVRVADGTFTLTAGKDGIHAENADDSSLGFLYIADGSFTIKSDGDGLDAASYLQVKSGTIAITAGGGSANAAARQEEMFGPGGWSQSFTTTDTDSISAKGIKSTGDLTVGGGTITVDSADDALHSNANLTIAGGALTLSSGDDGIHADANTSISNGTVAIIKSYEGMEGQTIDISGGTIAITASDDGLNAAGGNDQSGFGGGMRQDTFASDSSCYIRISGGTITINAEGDGIDSNGNLYVSGGETYVSGPVSSGNGALDYNGDAQITGGVVVAVGASGMAQNFGSNSTQGCIMVHVSGSGSGEVVLKDSTGQTLVTYIPEKTYTCVVISCPDIQQGSTYTLTAGGQTTSIEMTSLIYGSSGSMGGGMGGHGGMGW